MPVTQFLSDKNISTVLSSPHKRAVDTIAHFADSKACLLRSLMISENARWTVPGSRILLHSANHNGLTLIIGYPTENV